MSHAATLGSAPEAFEQGDYPTPAAESFSFTAQTVECARIDSLVERVRSRLTRGAQSVFGLGK